MRHTEYQLAVKVATLLDATPLFFTHVPLEDDSAKRAFFAKRMGASRGVPDILIFDRPGLAIELKSPKGRPTLEQKAWHDKLRSCGWRVEICKTVESVRLLLLEVYGQRIYDGDIPC